MTGSIKKSRKIDVGEYIKRSQMGPCFICEIVKGNPDFKHSIFYEDEKYIAFLDKYPRLFGYSIFAPKEHKEHVTGDFTLEEYLDAQRIIYLLSEAIRASVPTERIYLISLGSQQGNSHVHWHIAPLPPGVPYELQQTAIITMESGIVEIRPEEENKLVIKIRENISQLLKAQK